MVYSFQKVQQSAYSKGFLAGKGWFVHQEYHQNLKWYKSRSLVCTQSRILSKSWTSDEILGISLSLHRIMGIPWNHKNHWMMYKSLKITRILLGITGIMKNQVKNHGISCNYCLIPSHVERNLEWRTPWTWHCEEWVEVINKHQHASGSIGSK